MNLKKTGAIFLFIILLIPMVIVFSSCNKKENSTTVKTTSELRGDISLYCFEDEADALKFSAENFKKKYPQVNIKIIGKTDEGVNDYIINTLEEKNIPDAIQVRDENVKFYLANFENKFASVQDTSGYDSSNYTKYRVKNLSDDGNVYGFPFDSNPYAIFYRKDILEKQGIDIEDIKTWQDYIDLCKSLPSPSKNYLFALYPDNYNNIFKLLLSQIGDYYFNKDGDFAIDNDKTYNVLSLIKRFLNNGTIYEAKSKQDLMDKIKDGSICAIPAPANFIDKLKQDAPELSGKWGVAKLPSFENGGNRDSFADSSSFMIPSNSKNKKLVSEFMKYIVSDKENSSKLVSEYGVFCGSDSMYNDLTFESKNSYFSNQRVTEIFLNVINGVNEPYFSENSPLVNDMVDEEIGKIIKGNTDINKTLTQIEKSIKEKIKS